MKRDQAKDRFLDQHGITVLRYDDSDVKRNVSNVIEHLMQWIETQETRQA
jgi:very-short-patch-repair endonuclease